MAVDVVYGRLENVTIFDLLLWYCVNLFLNRSVDGRRSDYGRRNDGSQSHHGIRPNGKACALATKGPDANSAITATIATMMKVIPVFEFIKKRYLIYKQAG